MRSPADRRRFLGALVGLTPLLAQARASGEVAIVVHPDNELVDVSRGELERIFRVDRERWSDGQRIYLVMQEEGSFQKRIVLERIYRMTSDELKRFWLAKIYRGEMTSFPKTFSSDESILRFVSRVPNAIGFIDAARADRSVKVVSIEGRRSGQDGYWLREQPKNER